MPLPVIAGVLRISVGGNLEGGGRWANTWHAQTDNLADWDAGAINAFHAIFSQFYVGPALSGGVPVSGHITAASHIDNFAYTPLDGSSGAYNVSASVAGTGGGTCFPAECAEVITIRTAARGRQNRGRVYLPCFSGAFFSSIGHILGTAITDTLEQLDAVEAAIVVGGAHLGVASYGTSTNKAGVVHTWTPHFTPVQQFTMDDLVDVQRRRKT